MTDGIAQADGNRPRGAIGNDAGPARGEEVRLVRPGLEVVERRATMARDDGHDLRVLLRACAKVICKWPVHAPREEHAGERAEQTQRGEKPLAMARDGTQVGISEKAELPESPRCRLGEDERPAEVACLE